jgi:GR25 family glycosyltransferase involved in LPS biosynthesis
MLVVSDAYVINLDRSTNRMSRFKEANAHLGEIQRFSAVDGTKIDRVALEREGVIRRDLKYGPGSLGCALSHIALWRAALERRRSITIFEDDAVTIEDFAGQATRIINSLGDQWDFVLWGCNLNPSFAWIDLGVTRARLHVYGARRRNRLEIGAAAAPIKLLHAFGAFAYSVSPSGAKVAIEYCLPLRHRFITFPDTDVIVEDISQDVALCGLYPSIKAYLALPLIATAERDDASSDRVGMDRVTPATF